MKKMLCMLMALCLLLAGCQAAEQTDPQTESTVPSTAPVGESTNAAEEVTEEVTQPELSIETTGPAEDVALGETGKIRIEYTGNRSGVQYITDASNVPDYEELAGYDEAYFEEHALLVVIDTVTSGSMQVEIGGIQVQDGIASVTVDRKLSGDVGTTDMATWLLWAEVERGLEYEWTIVNTANGVKVYTY